MQIHDLDDARAVEDADDNGDSEETRDWKSLTRELIPSIADRLTTLGDYASMRLVCSSWGQNIDPFPRKTELLLPVMLCVHKPSVSMRLFDITHSRICTKELPDIVIFNLYRYSSNEFIISELKHTHKIVLTNIFTQAQTWLPAPPLDLLYDPYIEDVHTDARECISVVVSPPAPSSRRFVVAYQLNGPMFGCCELSTKRWSVYTFQNHNLNIASMVFYKGDLCAVLTDLQPITLTFRPEFSFTSLKYADGDISQTAWDGGNIIFEKPFDETHFICILADAGDDLLLVYVRPGTTEVHIFRWDCGVKKWVRPTSIGGRAVFVSYKGFLSWMFPCDAFWAKPDRVYVVDSLADCLEVKMDGTHQVCYRNLTLEDVVFPFPPFWIFPKFSNVG